MDFIHNDGTSGRDAPAQLPLIPLRGLTEVVEPPPSHLARKHSDIALLLHLGALQALLQGPTPLARLATLEGVADDLALINTLRQAGLQLPVRRIPSFDANYDIFFCDVCFLTAADVRRIHRALEKAEGATMRDSIFPKPGTEEGHMAGHHVPVLLEVMLDNAEPGQGRF